MKLLSQIKKEIEFNRNFYNLIEVLKEIAISQYRILEKQIKSFERIFVNLANLFNMLDTDSVEYPLVNTGGRPPAVIAVTSDTGLLGGLNMQVMNLAVKEVENNQAKLIIIGEKGAVYAQESSISFVSFKGIQDETRFSQAQQLKDYIIKEELKQNIGALKIIYPYPLSVVAQKVQILQLLPFSQRQSLRVSAGASTTEIIFESDLEDIVGYLVSLFLGHKFNEIFGLARLAELSARFAHLEESKTKLEQLNKQLRLQYFRQRHELIDRNMRELFAARLAFG